LSFNLITAIAESPRVVNTLYAGFKAVDKYSYRDVVIDVVYLNPRIYYAYRNSYVVPSKDTYIPPDQYQSIEQALDSIIEQLRSVGVEAKLITRYVAVGKTRDLGQDVVIIGLLDKHAAKYTIIGASSSRITTDKIDASNYIIVENTSRTYIVVDYTSLLSSEREKLVAIIRGFFKGLNKTILIYDSKALKLKKHTILISTNSKLIKPLGDCRRRYG
jgi:D-alanine-D-alanine ligase-like ATP-grasp enzyme